MSAAVKGDPLDVASGVSTASVWTRARIVAAGGSGLVRMAVGAGLFFVGVPLLIGALGTERYGVWVLITTVTGWLAFADFGLRTAVVRAVSRSSVDDDAAREADDLIGHASMLYLIVAIALAVLGLAGTDAIVFGILRVPALLGADAVFVVRLGIVTFALDLLSYGLLRGIIDGSGRVTLSNVWALTHMVLRWSLVLYAALMQQSLRLMSVGLVIASVCALVVGLALVRSIGKMELVRPRLPDWTAVKELARFAGVVQLNDSIAMATPQLVELFVVRKLGLEAVAIFDVGLQLSIHIRTAMSAAWYPSMPVLSRAYAEGQHAVRRISGAFRRLLNSAATIASGLLLMVAWWGFSAWLGVSDSVILTALVVLAAMGIGLGAQMALIYIWNAQGRPSNNLLMLATHAVTFVVPVAYMPDLDLSKVAWAGFIAASVSTIVGILVSLRPGETWLPAADARRDLARVVVTVIAVVLAVQMGASGAVAVGALLMAAGVALGVQAVRELRVDV